MKYLHHAGIIVFVIAWLSSNCRLLEGLQSMSLVFLTSIMLPQIRCQVLRPPPPLAVSFTQAPSPTTFHSVFNTHTHLNTRLPVRNWGTEIDAKKKKHFYLWPTGRKSTHTNTRTEKDTHVHTITGGLQHVSLPVIKFFVSHLCYRSRSDLR